MCQTLVLGAGRPFADIYHSLAKHNELTKNHVLVSKILSIHWLKGSPMPIKTSYILAILSRDNSPLGSHAPWEVDLGSHKKVVHYKGEPMVPRS